MKDPIRSQEQRHAAGIRLRELRDLAVLVVAAVVTLFFSAKYGAFELLYDVTRRYDDWYVDEIIATLVVLAFGFAIFAFRRWQDTKHEIAEASRLERRLQAALEETRRSAEHLLLLSQLGEYLQSCADSNEAYIVIREWGARLDLFRGGILYLLSASRNYLEAALSWGEVPNSEQLFPADGCWALRLGRPHAIEANAPAPPCGHLGQSIQQACVCIPMVAQNEPLGILHLAMSSLEAPELKEGGVALQFATVVADKLALALANLRLRETLRNQSIRDPLTGLYNRRYLAEALERELRRAYRNARPISAIMLDLDHFKRFNDAFGHEAGDTLLRAVGALLRSRVRADDFACRYGGEEFAVILVEATVEQAAARAESLRAGISELSISIPNQVFPAVTCSVGVAAFPSHANTALQLMRAADEALYAAKRQGRDQVVVAKAQPDAALSHQSLPELT